MLFSKTIYTRDYWQKFLLKKDLVWRHYFQSIITRELYDFAFCIQDLRWNPASILPGLLWWEPMATVPVRDKAAALPLVSSITKFIIIIVTFCQAWYR